MLNFFGPKNYLFKLRLRFDSPLCHIKIIHPETDPNDDLLNSVYILFLARYFFICNDRQINVVREVLLQEIINRSPSYEITDKIYSAILETLSESKRRAAISLFFLGIPPLGYSEDNEAGDVLAEYSFGIFKSKDKLASKFNMSLGGDIVLLPLSVGIIYNFIVDKLKDRKKRDLLSDMIVRLLKAYETTNYRSRKVFINLPNEILKRNNVL